MADSPVSGVDNSDSWLEFIAAQCDARRITAQISVRTLKSPGGVKEHHVKLLSDDDDCFLYRSIINTDEYRRLSVNNSFIASFDNLPQYFRQLLRAAKQENEYGQSYYINVVSPGILGITPRIELLITTRSAGYAEQNKVLGLPLTVASDADFKDYLTLRFAKMKKEKDQLRRSASFLESQLRRERARSREMEDRNHWLRKELKFTQNLLKSAESIQKHYEVILSLRHRGETGSTVVTIGERSSSQDTTFVEPYPADIPTDSSLPSTSGYTSSDTRRRRSPVIRKASTCFSQTSDDDPKRKISVYQTTDTSDSDDDGGFAESKQEKKNPPPRKFAAAVIHFDNQLFQIRQQEERKRNERMSEEEESGPGERAAKEWSVVPRKFARFESGAMDIDGGRSRMSTLPSPIIPRPMSPPSVMLPLKQEEGRSFLNSQLIVGTATLPTVLAPKERAKAIGRAYVDECPSDAK